MKSNLSEDQSIYNYIQGNNDGIKKAMSKMGISTLQSYKGLAVDVHIINVLGAQIFEILGLGPMVTKKCFLGTASRIGGSEFDVLSNDALRFHDQAFNLPESLILDSGEYHWINGGEIHVNDPLAVSSLQDAVRRKNMNAYEIYSQQSYEAIKNCTLRGLLDFRMNECTAIPIEQVEPWQSIVKRFCTGAMSYGSISIEAHSVLAVAVNHTIIELIY